VAGEASGSARTNVRFPPDLQEEATKTVLAQAELLSAMWAME